MKKKNSHWSVFRIKSFWFNWTITFTWISWFEKLLKKLELLGFCSSAVFSIKIFLGDTRSWTWLAGGQARSSTRHSFRTTPFQSICKWSSQFYQQQFNPIRWRRSCLNFRQKICILQAAFREIVLLSCWLFSFHSLKLNLKNIFHFFGTSSAAKSNKIDNQIKKKVRMWNI